MSIWCADVMRRIGGRVSGGSGLVVCGCLFLNWTGICIYVYIYINTRTNI